MAFCASCGNKLEDGVKFCSGCGTAIGEAAVQPNTAEEQKEKIILEAKGSLVGGGVGKIVLTNKHIMWSKSAANFAMGGALALMTKGSTSVNIDTILSIDTFTFLGGAGLQIFANDGKKYKFGFNKKAER